MLHNRTAEKTNQTRPKKLRLSVYLYLDVSADGDLRVVGQIDDPRGGPATAPEVLQIDLLPRDRHAQTVLGRHECPCGRRLIQVCTRHVAIQRLLHESSEGFVVGQLIRRDGGIFLSGLLQ